MSKFRKKPVVIDAFLLLPNSEERAWKFPWWLLNAVINQPPVARVAADGSIFIKTLEGEMHAQIGDWIIRGVKGELYPCKPDIFEATYEPVEDAQ